MQTFGPSDPSPSSQIRNLLVTKTFFGPSSNINVIVPGSSITLRHLEGLETTRQVDKQSALLQNSNPFFSADSTYAPQITLGSGRNMVFGIDQMPTEIVTIKKPLTAGFTSKTISPNYNSAILNNHITLKPRCLQQSKVVSSMTQKLSGDNDLPQDDQNTLSNANLQLESEKLARIVLENEESLFDLLLHVHKSNVQHLKQLETISVLEPIMWPVLYLSSWTALRVSRAVEIMKIRIAQRTFYPTVDISEPLQTIVSSCYQSFLTNDPERWKLKGGIFAENHNAVTHLETCRSKSGRDATYTDMKAQLQRWADKNNWMPSAIAHKRIAQCQKSSVFTLIQLLGPLQTNSDTHLVEAVEEIIAKNFLLLTAEEISPLSWHKENTYSATQLVQLDWTQINGMMQGDQLQKVLHLAQQQFELEQSLTKTTASRPKA